MKIHEVAKITKCSKRNIYFYIEEGLLSPNINQENNYYEFQKEDIDTLKFILQLRSVDMPLQYIKSILTFPEFSTYYLHSHYKKLELDSEILKEKTDFFKKFMENTLPTGNLIELSKKFDNYHPITVSTSMTSKIDAKILCMFMYQEYMGGEINDYHTFLFEKIIKEIENELDHELKDVMNIFASTPIHIIEEESKSKRKHIKYVTSLSNNEIDVYVATSIDSLRRFSTDQSLLTLWCQYRDSFIIPMNTFTSKIYSSLVELCPIIKAGYAKNELSACHKIQEILTTSEKELYDALLHNTDHQLDLKGNNPMELISLLTMTLEDFILLRNQKSRT